MLRASALRFAAPADQTAAPEDHPIPTAPNDPPPLTERVARFESRTIRDIMTTRADIVALPAETPLADAIGIIRDTGHSRIPVYTTDSDNVIGLLYAKDALAALSDGHAAQPVTAIMRRPAFFVPETIPLMTLLDELRMTGIHLALVVDEYGGIAGLVTLEDVLEALVGAIRDEYDTASVQVIDAQTIEVVGSTTLHEIQGYMPLAIEQLSARRIGGLVYQLLSRTPQVGDVVTHHNATIEVLEMQGSRPQRLRLRHCPAPCEPPHAPCEPPHARADATPLARVVPTVPAASRGLPPQGDMHASA